MSNETVLPPVCDVDELAAFWRVDRSHIYNACNSGELKHKRFGRVIRIERDVALRWFRGELDAA